MWLVSATEVNGQYPLSTAFEPSLKTIAEGEIV